MDEPGPSKRHGLALEESYQLDSDEYDSDPERSSVDSDEYEQLAEEGELLVVGCVYATTTQL
jgi:hypothetical protein